MKTPAQIDENNYITNRTVCQGDFFKKWHGKRGKCAQRTDQAVHSGCARTELSLRRGVRGDRAVPGDSGEPPRAKGGSLRKPAKSGVGRSGCLRRLFGLRTDVCGDVQRNHSFFSPARLADKRAPEPPSCQSPLPEARFLASGLHPSNVRTSAQLHRCSISSGPTADGTSSISPFARRINRAIPKMSGSGSFEARSTPRRKVLCVRAFDFVEAKGAQRTVRLGSST